MEGSTLTVCTDETNVPRTIEGITQDLNTLDEVQQNVEAAMLHIEGRLG